MKEINEPLTFEKVTEEGSKYKYKMSCDDWPGVSFAPNNGINLMFGPAEVRVKDTYHAFVLLWSWMGKPDISLSSFIREIEMFSEDIEGTARKFKEEIEEMSEG